MKKIPELLRGITSKDNVDDYCSSCLRLFRKKNLNHKKVCENTDFCNVVMPSEDTETLEFNQYRKSDKAPFIIYADLES